MRDELEDIGFRILNPEARASIIRRFLTLRRETGDITPRITEDIRHALAQAGVEATVFGREKKPYSIWRKMQETKEGFSRLSDIYGFRIITRALPDCYTALGAVHRRWTAVPGRFKDYISQPKSNGYRSIHTTVSAATASASRSRSAPPRCTPSPRTGVAAHWVLQERRALREPLRRRSLPVAAQPHGRASNRPRSPATSSNTSSSRCSRTRCSASRPRARS